MPQQQCRHWAKAQRCKYGSRCSFAHGPPEAAQVAEEVATVLLPARPGEPPGLEELEGGEEGLQRVYQLGRDLGRDGELYLELQGDFTLRLAIPASTKISAEDRLDWKRPVTLAGQSFPSINALQIHVRSLLTTSTPGTRLEGDNEQLLLALFEHHPWAAEKLKGVRFVEVKTNAYDPAQNSYYLMRSDEEGDDISYVKCLRALAGPQEKAAEAELGAGAAPAVEAGAGLAEAAEPEGGPAEATARSERVEVLASVRRGSGLEVRLGSWRESLRTAPETVGLHVCLGECTASLRVSNWLGPLEVGPAPVRPARQRQKREFPVIHIVDVPAGGRASVRFRPPFAMAPPLPELGRAVAPGPDGQAEGREEDEEEEVVFAGRCLETLEISDRGGAAEGCGREVAHEVRGTSDPEPRCTGPGEPATEQCSSEA